MENSRIDIIPIIILILLCIFDILKNYRIFNSKWMIITGTLSYISFIFFTTFLIIYPTNIKWLILIAILAIFPNGYFWYHRTTKEEMIKHLFLFLGLISALLIYILTQIYV
jgi:hypothetical protein